MDRKEYLAGLRDLSKKCPACGRPKTHHTVAEAKECQEDPRSLYPESVDPEMRYQRDLTRRRSS